MRTRIFFLFELLGELVSLIFGKALDVLFVCGIVSAFRLLREKVAVFIDLLV